MPQRRPPPVDPADVARVRHDLLTPLNAVAGFLAIVGEDVAALGRNDLNAQVRRMRAEAAEITAAVQSLAQPGRDGTLDADAVAALRARCAAPALRILRWVAEVAAVAGSGPPTLEGDLRQVERGAAALLSLLDELPARLRATP